MDFSKFKSLLDEQITWPDYYSFKFVAKTDEKHRVLELLEEHEVSEKESKTGKYTSITSRKILKSSDEVIEVYKTVSKVEGVITL
jgi:putative lipoic acid-binding regulatory protein